MSERTDKPTEFSAGFPEADREAWRALAEKAMKGASLDRLTTRTYEGVEIPPLAEKAEAPTPRALRPFADGDSQAWVALARIDHPDVIQANGQARDDIENGAAGLHLVFSGAAEAFGFGLDGAGAPEAALQTIDPAASAFMLDPGNALSGNDTIARCTALLDFIAGTGLDPASARASFGLDPLGDAARTGASADWDAIQKTLAGAVSRWREQGFTGRFLLANGHVVHAAGGGEAQELAFALACAVAYMRALEAGGMKLEDARRVIGFRLAADADQFLTISKFRALRSLWARVEEACGLAPEPAHIHAQTAWRMLTRRDPWVNILRTTTATFAAAAGGADAITALPFTQALGLPDAFARRLARNIQLILMEESHIAKVADPAAGAHGIEALTQSLCEAAWDVFQSIERMGSIASPQARAAIRSDVAAIRARRLQDVGTRKRPITGTSEYADLAERKADVLAPLAMAETTDAADRLAPMRIAECYEALREEAERQATNGAEPRVFLANLGNQKDYSARAGFAANFFAAGGIRAEASADLAGPEDAAAAFGKSGIASVCICSTDAIYQQQAVAVAKALRDAGAARIYLAGRPGELEAELRDNGVSTFIFAGCDALAILRAALGIED